MSIASNLSQVLTSIPSHIKLVAVTKTQPVEKIMELYNAGHKLFGENKVQELVSKYEQLPKDIQWHLIGHLQSNKVKLIAPFVTLIHSIDSIKLLEEVNKQAAKNNRVIDCLLQLHIATEETKFGLDTREALDLLLSRKVPELKNVRIVGLMGMASNTTNEVQIKQEFDILSKFYRFIKGEAAYVNFHFHILSMGMSSDYKLAVTAGSNLIRVGSLLFKD